MNDNITVPDFSQWGEYILSSNKLSSEYVAEQLRQVFEQGFIYGKRVGFDLGKDYGHITDNEG